MCFATCKRLVVSKSKRKSVNIDRTSSDSPFACAYIVCTCMLLSYAAFVLRTTHCRRRRAREALTYKHTSTHIAKPDRRREHTRAAAVAVALLLLVCYTLAVRASAATRYTPRLSDTVRWRYVSQTYLYHPPVRLCVPPQHSPAFVSVRRVRGNVSRSSLSSLLRVFVRKRYDYKPRARVFRKCVRECVVGSRVTSNICVFCGRRPVRFGGWWCAHNRLPARPCWLCCCVCCL